MNRYKGYFVPPNRINHPISFDQHFGLNQWEFWAYWQSEISCPSNRSFCSKESHSLINSIFLLPEEVVYNIGRNVETWKSKTSTFFMKENIWYQLLLADFFYLTTTAQSVIKWKFMNTKLMLNLIQSIYPFVIREVLTLLQYWSEVLYISYSAQYCQVSSASFFVS